MELLAPAVSDRSRRIWSGVAWVCVAADVVLGLAAREWKSGLPLVLCLAIMAVQVVAFMKVCSNWQRELAERKVTADFVVAIAAGALVLVLPIIVTLFLLGLLAMEAFK